MIRSFMPLDVVDLLVAGKNLSNKARTREDLGGKGARFGGLPDMVFGWFNPRQRSGAWVLAEGLSLKGLASVSTRYSARSWDVNRLMVGDQDHRSCLKLLEHVGATAGQLRIGRVFLCLAADSPLLKPAQETGFLQYSSEHLYRLENDAGAPASANGPPAGNGADPGLLPRRKKADDEYRLFELYLKCAPPQVRRAEGTTYGEWQSNRRRSLGQEWIFEKDGGVVGWVAISAGHDSGLLEIPAVTREDLEPVVNFGLSALGRRRACCLVPDGDAALQRLLEDRGFARLTTYSALMKELLVRVVEPYAMPAVPA